MAVVKVGTTPTNFNNVIQAATQALGQYSPANMRQSAAQQAAAQLHPQVVAQQNANQQQQTLLGNLYNRQTGFALAMGQLADPNGQQARNDYLAAANTMGTLGQGITGAVGADWKSAADQASQAAAGMTNQGSVHGLYDPSGLQASGYTTGFALPGASLADQATSAAADARNRQLATANQLGVMAANTSANQAMASTQGQQALAAIRAQQPAIFQSALQSNRQMGQQAFGNLAQVTGQAAQLQQQAQQFGVTSKEQALMDKASVAIQKGNLAVAQKYLGQAGAQIAGKVKAQTIANAGATQNMTGLAVDPATGKPTGKLAPGWIMVGGSRIPYSSYVQSITAQARLAMYADRSKGNIAGIQSKLTDTANQLLQAGLGGVKSKPTYTYQPTYNSQGKRTGTQAYMTKPGVTAARVPYNQMLQSLVALKPDDPKWIKQATMMVNARYPEGGAGGRPFSTPNAIKYATQQATEAFQKGLGANDILQGLLGYSGISTLTQDQVTGIVAKAYKIGQIRPVG